MRDRLIHGYFGIDYFIVWNSIEFDIPKILFSVSQIIDDFILPDKNPALFIITIS